MKFDADQCYSALSARDARFDGRFFVGVTSTGIYCRPICPARLPARKNCRFFASAAAAETGGFRPCLRCRPELAPGHAPVDSTARLAHAARARIESGALDEAPLSALASDLSVSERHVRRAVRHEYGASPVALAQTHRLLTAKRLLTESDLDVTRIAFSSGFSSVRRFNALFRERYRMSPSEMRGKRRGRSRSDGDTFSITLAYRPPFDWTALLDFLSRRAIRGVESVTESTYSRTIRLGDCLGCFVVEGPTGDRNQLNVTVSTSLAPELARLVFLLRSLFDLDADPDAIRSHFSGGLLGDAVERRPGLRVSGAVDGFELAVRAVLGQQVSVSGASTLAARMVERFAERFAEPFAEPVSGHASCVAAGLSRFPLEAGQVAEAPVEQIAEIGIPRKRAECISNIAAAVVSGQIDLTPAADPDEQRQRLLDLPGVGPWTADYILMRAVHWPDAFPAGDLGLRKAASHLITANGESVTGTRLARTAEAWRPWRSYAAMHLWASL